MPALIPTAITGKIDWLGHVPDRAAQLASDPQAAMDVTFAGPAGEDHGGLTRPSCSRVKAQYPRGTEIRNTRQFSIVSAEELHLIAMEMGIPAIDPCWIGATMVISGIPDFSHLPPSSRLQIEGQTTLTVDMQNRPCMLPAPVIEAHFEQKGKLFKSAAKGRRGLTAWVEREGRIAVGDSVTLHIPDQRPWRGL